MLLNVADSADVRHSHGVAADADVRLEANSGTTLSKSQCKRRKKIAKKRFGAQQAINEEQPADREGQNSIDVFSPMSSLFHALLRGGC